MSVQEEHVGALRAYLRNNHAEFERLTGQGSSSSPEVHSAMFSVAFLEAVRFRFGGQRDLDEIPAYVADLRKRRSRDGKSDIDPHAAEQLIHGALDDAVTADGLDESVRSHTRSIVLDDLVTARQMDENELKAFLSRVREETERRLASR